MRGGVPGRVGAVGAWILAIAAWLALVEPGVVVLGAVLGGLAALSAIGLVLIHQTNRFLHVGHASTGLAAGALTNALAAGWGWGWWWAALAGLGAGALLGLISESVLVGRLGREPRFVLVIASLGLAAVFGSVQGWLVFAGGLRPQQPPLDLTFAVPPVLFGPGHVLTLIAVPVCLLGTWLLLDRSRIGLAVRAVAQNDTRARSLALPVRALSRTLWTIAGILAAVGGILTVPVIGPLYDTGFGISVLLLALAPAVFARMRNLPLTVGAAIWLGIAHQALVRVSPTGALSTLGLAAAVGVALLVSRGISDRRSSAEEASSWTAFSPVRPIPDAMRQRTIVRMGRPLAVGAVLLVGMAVPFLLGAADAQRWGLVASVAMAALALGVVTGLTGRLSLGHWGLAVGGVAIAANSGPLPDAAWGLPAAVLVGAPLGMVLGWPSRRRGTLAAAAATLAFALAVPGALVTFGLLDLYDPLTGMRFAGAEIEGHAPIAAVTVLLLALATAGVVRMRRGRLGLEMVAVRDSPAAAAAQGIAPLRAMLTADAISGAIAAVAGYLYMLNLRLPHPEAFGTHRSLILLAMAVIGGLGSPAAAVAGAVVVQAAALFLPGLWGDLVAGFGVLAVVLARPGGLAGLLDPVGELLFRRRIPIAPPVEELEAATVPPAETRRAREHPVVRRMQLAVLGAAALAWSGIFEALRRIVSAGLTEAWVAWPVVAAVGVCWIVGVVASRRGAAPRWVAAAVATGTAAGFVAGAGSETLALLTVLPSAWVAGGCVGVARRAVPKALDSAAAGMLAATALGAVVAAGLVQLGSGDAIPAGWFTAFAVLGASPLWARLSTVGERREPVDASGAALAAEELDVILAGRRVLRGVDLELQPGQIVALCGPNGAGKSTLLRTVAGLHRPSAGRITADGEDVTLLAPEELARRGVVLVDGSAPVFGELTVAANLRVAAFQRFRSRGAASRATDVLQERFPLLGSRRDELAGTLSGGEQRLLALAQTFLQEPRVLLLDELAVGLSPRTARELLSAARLFAERGAAVVIVDHGHTDALAMADRGVVLEDGRIRVDGTPADAADHLDRSAAELLGGSPPVMEGT